MASLFFKCRENIANNEVNQYLLIPSFLVTIGLYSFEYFKERKVRLIPPFETLIYSNSNQKAIVFAFGKIFFCSIDFVVTTDL